MEIDVGDQHARFGRETTALSAPHFLIRKAACIILDFDGVIADSEEFQLEQWKRVFVNHSLPTDRLTIQAIAGISDRLVIERILPGGQADFYEQLVSEKKQLCVERREEVRLVPGVLDFITSIHHRKMIGICSSSTRAAIQGFADKHLPRDSFNFIVGREDYVHRKPHPEPYQTALKRAAVHQEEVVGVEDSLAGVQSALAAGVRVIHLNRYELPIAGVPTIASMRLLSGWERHENCTRSF